MKNKLWVSTLATLAISLLTIACSVYEPRATSATPQVAGAPTSLGNEGTGTPTIEARQYWFLATPEGNPTREDKWGELLLRTPFPYTTPLPPVTPSVLDGIYAKMEDRQDTPVPCRRCPDYAPFRGVWRLQFDKGIFRVYYEFWNWTSMGSYTMAGDEIAFFNDPNCTEDVGTYTWKLEKGRLTLTEIKDDCAIRMRVANFTSRPWMSCQPPNLEAAITDHWIKPPGCL